MNKNVLKIGGLVVSLIGAGASIVGGIISEKQMKVEIAEEVSKQMAELLKNK